MLTKIFKFWLLATVIFAMACSTAGKTKNRNASTTLASDAFVTVRDGQFYIGEQPYHFVGTNFWYGAYLGASEKGRERLLKELDLLARLGVTNLRVLAGSEASELSMAVSPAIIKEPGVYDESILLGLDYLLDEMAKRNMKAVLYFTNFWQWSGGMAQYVAWDKNEKPHDPDVQGDWNGFMQYSAQFYSSERAMSWFEDFVTYLVGRTNTVNGKTYIEDATIMSWELANEPRPGSDADGALQYEGFKAWLKSAAGLIHQLDPNHLVTTGSEGSMGTSGHMDWFQESHAIPEIDYLTFHLWPKNWSWYNANDVDGTFSSALLKTKAYILRHVEAAKTLGKPIVLEEFGLERDGGAYSPSVTTAQRDVFLTEIYDLIEQQIKIGAPLVGSNVWAWGGYGRAQSVDFIWQPGDPFTGDPPQEPQGLNSIFDTDQSTLKILSEHAAALNEIH